ncbi:hypothetical protein, partial [Pseudonocardia acaciae]|uniref:hypothetical protein n=1 Tax=Pseudonocardia acaciae TaxID=551276 RepID=UPI00056A7A09
QTLLRPGEFDPARWELALAELRRIAATPPDERTALDRLLPPRLVEALDGLAAIPDEPATEIASLLLTVITGKPGRDAGADRHALTDLVRWHATPDLAAYREPVAAIRALAPEDARFQRAGLDLIHVLIRLDPLLARLGRRAEAVDALNNLAATLPTTPPNDRTALLTDATAKLHPEPPAPGAPSAVMLLAGDPITSSTAGRIVAAALLAYLTWRYVIQPRAPPWLRALKRQLARLAVVAALTVAAALASPAAAHAADLSSWAEPTGFLAYAVWGAVDLFWALGWAVTGGWARALTVVNVLNWAAFLVLDTIGLLTGTGVGPWSSGFFVPADAGLLAHAVTVAHAVWTGRPDPSRRPAIRRTLRAAYPLITIALTLLAVQLAGTPAAAAVIPLVPVVLGFSYLSRHNLVTQPGHPEHATRPAFLATVAAALGLLGYGLARLATHAPLTAAVTAAALAVVGLALARLPAGTGPASAPSPPPAGAGPGGGQGSGGPPPLVRITKFLWPQGLTNPQDDEDDRARRRALAELTARARGPPRPRPQPHPPNRSAKERTRCHTEH